MPSLCDGMGPIERLNRTGRTPRFFWQFQEICLEARTSTFTVYLEGWWAVANWEEVARRFELSDHSAEQDWEDEGGLLLAPKK